MGSFHVFRRWIILAFALLLLPPVGIAGAQNPAYLTVTVTGQVLTAGFDNNVTVTVINNYSRSLYPSSTIFDVDVAISLPAPLHMSGGSRWHYESIALHQSVTISFQVYAPTSAIGNSYQGSVTVIYRQPGDISYTQESHAISFSVRGWIKLVLYGVQVTPSVTSPGGNATVSGSLLNNGNVAAYNANVTVNSEALAPGSQASVFLGEISPNIPRPFSLLVNFKKNLTEGTYPLVVKVSAIDIDRPSSPYDVQFQSQIQIRKAAVQPPSRPQQDGGVIAIILEILRYLYGVFFGSLTTAAPALWS
jgi:hypothetical protein